VVASLRSIALLVIPSERGTSRDVPLYTSKI
jgi:hypothetical protein